MMYKILLSNYKTLLSVSVLLFSCHSFLMAQEDNNDMKKRKYELTDGHFHLLNFVQETEGIKAAAAVMKASGVTHSMLSGMPLVKKWEEWALERPTYYLDDDGRCYWYSATDVLVAEQYKLYMESDKRDVEFHPFICGINSADRNAVDHVKRLLDLYPDTWHGIGEVMTRHDDLTALTYSEVSRANNKALDSLLVLAERYDLPTIIHSDIGSKWLDTPAYAHEVITALKNHPNSRIIWAHAGISRDIKIPGHTKMFDDLLSTYDNLWIDISWVIWPQEISPGGKLNQEWVQLIKKHPNKVIIGSDILGEFEKYQARIDRYYQLLDALPEDVARKVASENFLRILPKKIQNPKWYKSK